MDLKDTLVEIKELSREDILAKMRSGEIDVPADSESREEFTRYVTMDSAGREEYLAGLDNPDGAPSGDETPEPDTTTPAEDETVTDRQEPQQESGPDEQPAESDDWLGYGSREALADAHKSIVTRVGDLQRQIDKLNASNGKVGRRNKDLEQEISRLTGELDSLGKGGTTDKGHSSGKTSFPEPPDPEKYSSGVFDDDYQAAVSQYQRDMHKLVRQQNEELSGLKSTIEELNTGVKRASDFVENTETQTREQAWNSFWGKIHDFQGKHGLSTTIPIEEINRAVLEKNRAVLDSLPPADVKKYNTIRPLANEFADFSENKPKLRYDTVDEMVQSNQQKWSAFASNPKTGLTPDEDANLRDKKRQQAEQTADVPSSESQGSPTERVSELPEASAKQRLVELQKIRSTNVSKFDSNRSLYDEYLRLRQRFGIAPKVR
jgi:hypothetical protein